MLAAANLDFIALYGRREFSVIDAATGELRWKCEDVPAHSTVFASEDTIYLLPPDRREAAMFRAVDGRRLDAANVGDLLVNAVAVLPRGIVVAEKLTGVLGLQVSQMTLRGIDPARGKEYWRVSYPGGTLMTLLDDRRLLTMSADG